MDNLEFDQRLKISRQGQWFSSLKASELSTFLGVPSDKIYMTTKEYRGLYYRNIIVVCFEDFLKETGYTISSRRSYSDQDYWFITNEDIEITPGVFKRAMINGYFFLEHEGHKLIVEFQDGYRHEQVWFVELYYQIEDESFALSFSKSLDTYARQNSYLRKAKVDAALTHIPLATKLTWDDVILPAKDKNEIQKNVTRLIDNLQVYKDNNIAFKRGLILQGKPGTGKTLIGKIICQSVDCTFIWVTPRHLTTSGQVKSICDTARELSPSVLFLEDIDLYGEDRKYNINNALLGELMNQLDGIVENNYVVVIATTNKVDELETALRNRPGRFDRVIEVPSPSLEGRMKMLELYTKPYELAGIDLNEIARRTNEYTGAHVKELVNTALITAIDESSLTKEGKVILKPEHFLKNIARVGSKKIEPVMGFKSQNETDDDDDDLHEFPPFRTV